MSPEERTQFEQMVQTVNRLNDFIERNFNQDGTPKAPPIVIQAQDAVTTPGGSIRVETNLGPKNILVV
jgi:hypothetical protein